VCSSPQLIAAYHVLLRLLEPRHPPCALICFKTIQIFYGVLPPLIDLERSKSYSVLQLFFPICQRAIPRFQGLADVVIMNHQTNTSSCYHIIQFQKNFGNLLPLLAPGRQRPSFTSRSASGCFATLHRAIVFQRAPPVGASTGPLSLNELRSFGAVLVEDIGVEPMTPCLQSRCSSQLS
jgi:hypothetical protein